ncbi:TrkA family potassium uptake protein [Fervidicoccus fontis]|uniref:TrkA-N domain protein n=2 Tax=Fervidicoccus fontis TaxID=683846 RepID=I0A0R7_FERFK|nr:NAD-binding protein [Fervidicoccus fontis]AFH42574.1 TrkA-N domain protein [Fervidicoccus fontis Kam940]MBE9391182.1 TrkA family potassium uptake protein [Fervidicoccus fontis]PMB75682.1 MAG: Trk system potassium transporter TrkA [Fervidicoccus fontis]PMB78174.1 MAG: Trk system potassium transporter TrkA [Fervidicoccus fontis]HEW64018.1 TrkA family potassium uptake protein [Fervidicoccus fontis]
MRHVIVGSTHFTTFALKGIREADPSGIIIVIERSIEVATIMAKQVNGKAVAGDLRDKKVLESAEINLADTFFSLTDSDALNIKLCSFAKKDFSVPIVVGLINNPMNYENMREAGADFIIDPTLFLENYVKSIIAIDRPVKYELPNFLGLDILALRPSKLLEGKEALVSFVKNINTKNEVKAIRVLSSKENKPKNIDEIEQGDYLIFAIEKEKSEGFQEKIKDFVKKTLGLKET